MTIKEHFEKYIEFKRSLPKSEKFIENYITNNIDALTTNSFSEGVVFGANLRQDLLNIYDFDERSFKSFKRTNEMLKSGYVEPSEPLNILLLLSYNKSNKNKQKRFLDFLAIKLFTSKYNKFFKNGVHNERMDYTISKLSGRYGIKKHGTLLKTLEEAMLTIEDAKVRNKYFKERINRLDDEDILHIMNRVSTTVNHMVKEVANEYYETEKSMWKDEEVQDKDNLRVTTNDSLKFETVKNSLKSNTVKYGLDVQLLKEVGGIAFKKDFQRMFDKDSRKISKLYSIIIDDYIKNVNTLGVDHAKRYGFIDYYKKSRKKDPMIKSLINDLTGDYCGGNKSKFYKVFNQYLVVSIHRELQKI